MKPIDLALATLAANAVAAFVGACEPSASKGSTGAPRSSKSALQEEQGPPQDAHGSTQEWQTEVVWRGGGDRLEVDRLDDSAMGRPSWLHRVRLVRRGLPLQVIDARRKRFTAAATRLGDGRVAWIADDVACSADMAGQPSCVDLGDVHQVLPGHPCTSVVAENVRCRSAFELPEASLSGALHWIAARAEADVSVRVAAVVVLARGGDAPEPVASALDETSLPDGARTWLDGAIARTRGAPAKVAALRRTLAEGSQYVRMTVAQSCVPELAADVAAARATLASEQPDFAAQLAEAEKACAALPRPRR